ncbi:two-component sensor histidine kinase [Lentzea sp. NBRC 105346]|uniref:sensor histidine kinase n=1 Tax=Lentzea sp. NBRC 105346 TaxID=3032205 RepID=UPI0024A0ABD7|nr:sensor histidine kinase [Lentzea sp. NBRC 105346]GLZ34361.1 two-component sensor histidine kinase [Lentzea sp. NBRC 105346]
MDQRQPVTAWNFLFAVTQVTTVVILWFDNTPVAARLAATGCLALNALWFVFYGRRLTLAAEDSWHGFVYVAVMWIPFTAATWFTGSAAFALFGLVPQIYMVLPLAWAFPPMVLFVLTPTVVEYLLGGKVVLALQFDALIIGFSHAFGWAITRIAHQNAQRGVLLEQIETLTREAERARLSAEIHDTLAQGFTSIITLLQAREPNVELALQTARENLREARALVAATAPSPLDGTLEDALRRLVSGVEIDASFRVIGDVRALPTSVEVVLLRSAQEALHNVRKHSEASSVAVVLQFFADSVRLEVSDDGRGFGDAPEGFGLRGMRARLEQVGGRLTLGGGPGASLLVEVPL